MPFLSSFAIVIALTVTNLPGSSYGQEPSILEGSKCITDPATQIDRSTIDTAAKGVVRINWGATTDITGVVVSEDGYIVWNGAVPPRPEVTVRFSSGNTCKAKNLGWSIEWRVGLLKLLDDEKWPHVAMGSTRDLNVDDICFEIGYDQANDEPLLEEPRIRLGRIRNVSQSQWFSTDIEPTSKSGAATFDKDGRLLGIVSASETKHQVSTAIDIVALNWQSLVNAKNLDWVRFPPSELSRYRRIASPQRLDQTGVVQRVDVIGWEDKVRPTINEGNFQEAKQIAVSTTVRIRGKDGREGSSCWSGIIISPNGHVATCAHTLQLPGERLTIVLPDNRSVPAKSLGSNWVSDIGLVKIMEEGPWPYAKLGDSSILEPDGAVLMAGFPAPDSEPLNGVTMEINPFQRTPYISWNPEIMIESDSRDTKLHGGSSGGGCFDQNGNLVAILGSNRHGLRIEMLQAQLPRLKTE